MSAPLTKTDLKYVNLHIKDIEFARKLSLEISLELKAKDLNNVSEFDLEYAFDLVFNDLDAAKAALLGILKKTSFLLQPIQQALEPPIESNDFKIDNFSRLQIEFDFLSFYRMYTSTDIEKFSLIGTSLVLKLPFSENEALSNFLSFVFDVVTRVQSEFFQPIQHLWIVPHSKNDDGVPLPVDTISKSLSKYTKAKLTFNCITSSSLLSISRPANFIAYMSCVDLPQNSLNWKSKPRYFSSSRSSNGRLSNTMSQLHSASSSFQTEISNGFSLLNSTSSAWPSQNNTLNRAGISAIPRAEISVNNSLSKPLVSENKAVSSIPYLQDQLIQSFESHNTNNNNKVKTISKFTLRGTLSGLLSPSRISSPTSKKKAYKKSKKELEFEQMLALCRKNQLPWTVSVPLPFPSSLSNNGSSIFNLRFIVNFVSKRVLSLYSISKLGFLLMKNAIAYIPETLTSVYNLSKHYARLTIHLSRKAIQEINKLPFTRLFLLMRNHDSQSLSLFVSWICACFVLDVNFASSLRNIGLELFSRKRLAY
ncbi:hypothetical protein BB560_006970 [Smittium megazygosporum]|uniref:Uncharacterized protein n=1 Tax=Smittium megazygosporum TaxID=133381 RepID=A0A2T9XZV6_9FUNG|nr:hypothetical protein BB560_006970 [Smittium megazygosporum]